MREIINQNQPGTDIYVRISKQIHLNNCNCITMFRKLIEKWKI